MGKVPDQDNNESSSDESIDEENENTSIEGPHDDQLDNDDDEDDNDDDEGVDDDGDTEVLESPEERQVKPKKVHKLSLTETENFNEKLKKRGVLYIARVPPRMTPTKVKALLSEFCEVTRVYLVEEDPTVRKRRKKEHGKSGGKRYVEGWVEMANKRKAKHIAQSLNNSPISNHKRNPHYGTLHDVEVVV